MPDLRQRLRQALQAAFKEQDEVAASALRSALSAVANAEAVDPVPAKIRLGVGAGDVARRDLTAVEILAILQAEIDERTHAAVDYERLGQDGRARRLRSEAAVLRSLVEAR